MRHNEFVLALRQELKKKTLSKEEIDFALAYYEEMILDAIEHGKDEEILISNLGTIQAIASRVTAEAVGNRKMEKTEKGPLKNFLIILALCTSPILVLLAFVFAMVFFGFLMGLFGLFFGLAMGAIAIIVTIVPALITMIVQGATFFEIAMAIGSLLMAGSALTIGALFAYKAGYFILTKITQGFAKAVSKTFKRGETYGHKSY